MLKPEADVNRIAKGITNVIDKSKQTHDKVKSFLGCESSVVSAGCIITAIILTASALIIMRYKK